MKIRKEKNTKPRKRFDRGMSKKDILTTVVSDRGGEEQDGLLHDNSMNDVYDKIIDITNIEAAYLEVVAKFDEANRSHQYRGIDGKSLSDYDFFSVSLFEEIREELINKTPINPALETHIPKRNKPGTRPVYVHTVKERIKAQAVYRIIEPIFDTYFSPYLYSYRTTHPHYKAITTVVRRYKKQNNEQVLVGDISSYSDIINPDILKKKIRKLPFDTDTYDLLDLYVDMQFLIQGTTVSSEEGIITGLPITVMFNNLYLDAFDKHFGEHLSLYRRVGDDFIAFDTETNLKKATQDMETFLVNTGIKPSSQKISVVPRTEPFTFLGYLFHNNMISIPPQSLKNIQKRIRYELKPVKTKGIKEKVTHIKNVLSQSFKHYIIQIVRQYNHVDDQEQIASLSRYAVTRLVIYFFGTYTARNHRKTKELMHGISFPSFMKYYVLFHTGQVKGSTLKYVK